MIPGKFKSNLMPIGIDLGSQCLRLLQFARTAHGVQAIAAASRPLDPTIDAHTQAYHQQIQTALQACLSEGDFKGKKVVSTLPASVVRCKNLRLPPMPDHEMKAAIDWEAAERLRSNLEQTVQYLDAGEVKQGTETRREVILLAVDEQFTERHVEVLTSCGLQPTAIDAVPTALARVFDTRLKQSESEEQSRTRVIIDLGYDSVKVLILRAGRVVFYKRIEIGGAALDQAVAESLSIPLDEAATLRREACQKEATDTPQIATVRKAIEAKLAELGREIGLCLRYYSVTFRGTRPSQALLLGGGSLESWTAMQIEEHAGVKLVPADFLQSVNFEAVAQQIPDHERRLWAVAAGLGLRGGLRETDAPLTPSEETELKEAA